MPDVHPGARSPLFEGEQIESYSVCNRTLQVTVNRYLMAIGVYTLLFVASATGLQVPTSTGCRTTRRAALGGFLGAIPAAAFALDNPVTAARFEPLAFRLPAHYPPLRPF